MPQRVALYKPHMQLPARIESRLLIRVRGDIRSKDELSRPIMRDSLREQPDTYLSSRHEHRDQRHDCRMQGSTPFAHGFQSVNCNTTWIVET